MRLASLTLKQLTNRIPLRFSPSRKRCGRLRKKTDFTKLKSHTTTALLNNAKLNSNKQKSVKEKERQKAKQSRN